MFKKCCESDKQGRVEYFERQIGFLLLNLSVLGLTTGS